MMTDEQLARNLKSVGQACFVRYFALFSSEVAGANIVEILKSENSFTERSCRSRTSHARSIIRAGFSKTALQMVVSSDSRRVTEETRAKAKELLHSHTDG